MRVGRAGRTILIVGLATFFGLVGLLMVSVITGFGLAIAHCVPGAPSVHGMTPMVGGGEMNSRLCASHIPVGVWPWPVISVVTGAAVGGIFAAGLIHVFRAGIGRLSRWRKSVPDLWLSRSA
jgi:hypothetical protein